jgi:hypothetical protein
MVKKFFYQNKAKKEFADNANRLIKMAILINRGSDFFMRKFWKYDNKEIIYFHINLNRRLLKLIPMLSFIYK